MDDNKFWLSCWSLIAATVTILSAASIPSCHRESMRKLDIYEKCITQHTPLECAAAGKVKVE